ncbi:MAG: hypothetical protein AVDCRST_MAG73-1189 [uncultured Thermomicrobiales bacterium]|uniref:Uncharacterized protein n=1 Tax=uncultured Thermomicrobiales bacterium TaxID=1645740 RepID=A0A6J4TVR4_9BACT|nr:MAG: hypothetical protein AVDCRST_MAG73-1189 [uncultured Thermomicrobiales bacterium]
MSANPEPGGPVRGAHRFGKGGDGKRGSHCPGMGLCRVWGRSPRHPDWPLIRRSAMIRLPPWSAPTTASRPGDATFSPVPRRRTDSVVDAAAYRGRRVRRGPAGLPLRRRRWSGGRVIWWRPGHSTRRSWRRDRGRGRPYRPRNLPFPFSTEIRDRLKLSGVDGGDRCGSPESDSARDGSYTALFRSTLLAIGRDTPPSRMGGRGPNP